MQKKLLFLTLFVVSMCKVFSQANLLIEAPLNNGSTTQVRAPNGLTTSAYMRACSLVLASELTNMPASTTITAFGFTLTSGTSGVPVAGNFTVYLQNTADITYTKSTNYAAAIAGMTSVYASIMTIPLSATTASILLTLSTPFVYGGAGLYVAYDWFSTGPFSATPATYLSESTALNPGCASASSNLSAPPTLATTNFRPAFLFQAINTNTNDIQVVNIMAMGKISVLYNAPQSIKATILNASNIAKSGFNVTLNAIGANPYTNSQPIGLLAAGASTTITFSPFYNPTLVGISTLSVSVGADQNNLNNSVTYAQNVNCNYIAKNPGVGSYTFNSVGFGAGAMILGFNYLNPATANIIGVNFAVSTNVPSVGNQVYGVLLNPGGTILATTNTLTITTPMLGTFQELYFTSPLTLFASTNYVLGMAQMAGATAFYPAGTQASSYVEPTLYVTCPLTGGVYTPLTTNFGYFGIEAIFSHTFNPVITANPSSFCLGNTATLTATGPVSNYTWSTGSNLITTTVAPVSTTAYSVITTNSLGCVSRTNHTVLVNPIPNINIISSSPSVCIGGTVNLYAAGVSSYVWSTGATTPSISVTPTATTGYTLTGSSLAGCSNSISINIAAFEPSFIVSPNGTVCLGSSITMSASSASTYNYLWSTGWPSAQVILTPTSTTVYSVTATDNNLCTLTQTVEVVVNPNPTVVATSPATVMCKGEPMQLTALGANTYTWNNGTTAANNVITSSVSGTFNYSVTGSYSTGCASEGYITIKVGACVGISGSSKNDVSVEVFPNPASFELNLNLGNITQNIDLELYNNSGQRVYSEKIREQQAVVDIRNLASGLYLIKLSSNGQLVYTGKLIKE